MGNDVTRMFHQAAEKAVAFAAKSGYSLDYSHQSVVQVELLLSQLYDELHTGPEPSEEELSMVANTFGSYLGNTLIKNLGKGSWAKSISDAWAVTIDKAQYLFPSKVYRRLENGDEDNVVFMYMHAYNQHSDTKIDPSVFKPQPNQPTPASDKTQA